MFSKLAPAPTTHHKVVHTFLPSKAGNTPVVIERIENPNNIDQVATMSVLVESFIGEYKKYLSPQDIRSDLTSWREGEHSVEKYYEEYFYREFKEIFDSKADHKNYWIQASINGKVVGWATFLEEKSEPKAVYMNLLVVHPDYQGRNIGEQLVKSLINLQIIPDVSAIHLLLRKKNQGGRIFYTKIGFYSDPGYQRDDNFVNSDLLEGLSWKNPALENKNTSSPTLSNRR